MTKQVEIFHSIKHDLTFIDLVTENLFATDSANLERKALDKTNILLIKIVRTYHQCLCSKSRVNLNRVCLA